MKLLWCIASLFLSSCVIVPSFEERRRSADELAALHGWRSISLEARQFDLMAYMPSVRTPGKTLTIFVEGDGYAWIDRTLPSFDPTPRDPVALRLALAHQDGNVAYLGRPCQYIDAELSKCSRRYWTEERFAPEVIAATAEAIDILKRSFGASRLILVGYSGGGAVATLVAARRNDIEQLVTVAGNLDHRAWTTHHRITPLVGSLNPADQVDALREIAQWHLVGANDTNITPEIVQGFANRFPQNHRPVVTVKPGFDHRCCWAENWTAIWRQRAEAR